MNNHHNNKSETISKSPEDVANQRNSEKDGSLNTRLSETEELLDEALRLNYTSEDEKHRLESFDRVPVWGLLLARVTAAQTVDLVDELIQRERPGLFITANLHYAMLSDRHLRMQIVNARATFILADGMPMVWYSRLKRQPLPERVTGADMIFKLCERAAQKGHRVYFLGGEPDIARYAAEKLIALYPGLQVAGTEAPIMNELDDEQHRALIDRIRSTNPDLLFVALGQPRGERWLAEHCQALGVPVCVQVGASFDFVAEKVKRAPIWIQRIGMEWIYRITREPLRMAPRYFQDGMFLLKALSRELFSASRRKISSPNKIDSDNENTV